MIKSIQIKNFKSVVDLTLNLGTLNVLIGENGCGKSNILEAISFGAAASADKLDYEFLGSRGIRVTDPEFMYSAFSSSKKKQSIKIKFATDREEYHYKIENAPTNPKKWINKSKYEALKEIDRVNKAIFFEDDEVKRKKIFEEIKEDKGILKNISDSLKPFRNEADYKKLLSHMNLTVFEKVLTNSTISNYLIYSPEESSLRKFEETTQIYPLGKKGEGLFQFLKELAFEKKNSKTLNAIKHNLILLDWYESFELPENLMKNEYSLRIKDKYLFPKLQYFDQRSANEGFLFLLFYSTLFIVKATPTFFAIDNIDVAFNPKLCMQLTKNLSQLAKKYKKQVIITTQNPAVLDGLNLKDDNQRLFVVRRNDEGHTKAKRVEYKSKRKLKLSEVWTSGFIGGLPENF